MTSSEGDSQRDRGRRGSSLLVVIIVSIFLGLLVPLLLRSFTIKNRLQGGYRTSDAMDSVVKAVAAKAVGELRDLTRQYGGGPFPAAARYTAGNPRIFAKGDPAFYIEEFQFNGTSFVPRKFLAPENDPRVWIDAFGPGVTAMPLRIQMTVCRVDIAGRLTPGPPYNLGVAWPVPCPPSHIIQVNYTGLVLRNNL